MHPYEKLPDDASGFGKVEELFTQNKFGELSNSYASSSHLRQFQSENLVSDPAELVGQSPDPNQNVSISASFYKQFKSPTPQNKQVQGKCQIKG